MIVGLGELDRTITIYDPLTVEGDLPPAQPWPWWSLVVAAVVLGGLWYLSREERDRDGRPPFGEVGS